MICLKPRPPTLNPQDGGAHLGGLGGLMICLKPRPQTLNPQDGVAHLGGLGGLMICVDTALPAARNPSCAEPLTMARPPPSTSTGDELRGMSLG
jgi:hypothetical protein